MRRQRRRLRPRFFFWLIALSITSFAANAGESTVISGEVEPLAKLIHLPAPPKSVRWMLTPLSDSDVIGPTDYDLLALLEYDGAICDKIVRDSKADATTMLLSPKEVADWLPVELRDHIVREDNGYYRVIGTTFAPTLFAKGAFLQGFAIRLDHTDLLLVALRTN